MAAVLYLGRYVDDAPPRGLRCNRPVDRHRPLQKNRMSTLNGMGNSQPNASCPSCTQFLRQRRFLVESGPYHNDQMVVLSIEKNMPTMALASNVRFMFMMCTPLV